MYSYIFLTVKWETAVSVLLLFCLAIAHSCVVLFSFCAVCTFCRRYNSWCCGRHKTRCKYVSTFRSMWISTPSVSRYLSKATMVLTKEALDQIKIAASVGPWTILIKWHTQLHNHFYYRCKAGERAQWRNIVKLLSWLPLYMDRCYKDGVFIYDITQKYLALFPSR